MKGHKLLLGVLSLGLLLALASGLSAGAPGAAYGHGPRVNSEVDGYAGLAVGVPEEDVGALGNAGEVNVLYSSSGGLSTTDSQWFDQNTSGLPGSAEAQDFVGGALAAGD